jgi:hypothetical protein
MCNCCAWCAQMLDETDTYFVMVRDEKGNLVGYASVCYDCWTSWYW